MLGGADEKIEREKREIVDTENDITELTEEEIEKQIKRLKKKKAPGGGGMRSQMRHGSTVKGTWEEN